MVEKLFVGTIAATVMVPAVIFMVALGPAGLSVGIYEAVSGNPGLAAVFIYGGVAATLFEWWMLKELTSARPF